MTTLKKLEYIYKRTSLVSTNKALTSGVNEDSEDIFNTTRDKEVDPNELINNILQTVSVLPDDEQARVRAIQGIALDIRTLIGISSWYTRFVGHIGK